MNKFISFRLIIAILSITALNGLINATIYKSINGETINLDTEMQKIKKSKNTTITSAKVPFYRECIISKGLFCKTVDELKIIRTDEGILKEDNIFGKTSYTILGKLCMASLIPLTGLAYYYNQKTCNTLGYNFWRAINKILEKEPAPKRNIFGYFASFIKK